MDPEKSNPQPPLKWLTLTAIFILVLIVYRGALENGFVNWDDHEYVYENPLIQSLSAHNLWEMVTGFHAGNWHPLTWFSHAIDYQLFGLDPWGHHLTSILLHALNTCLVFVLFLKLCEVAARDRFAEKNVWIVGALAALVFGLHPLRVESVAWVAERKDLLCAFFFLSTVLLYLSYQSATSTKKRKRFYLLSIFTFVLALLSKPMAVTLPVVLLLLDAFPLDRFQSRIDVRKVLLEKFPFFLLSLLSVILTVLAQKSGAAIRTLEESGLGDRVLNAVRSVSFYLEQTLWPGQLVPFYPFPENLSLASGAVLGSALVILAITVSTWVLWRKGKKLAGVAWLYYLVTVSPVIGIVQVGGQAAADRYTYLPTLSLYLLLGALVVWALEVKRASFKNFLSVGALAAGVVVLILLGALTVRQIPVWKNGETLWQEVIREFPETAARAYMNLGFIYFNEGSFEKAEAQFKRAKTVNAKLADAYNNLGLIYFRENRLQEAEKEFEMARQLNPRQADAPLIFLGQIYQQQEDYEKAEANLKAALAVNPQSADARNRLGVVYYETGRLQAAEAEYLKALDLNPGHQDAHNNLGIVYYATGSLEAAEKAFQRVLELDPDHQDARNNLGVVYYEITRLEAAEKEFQAILKKAPNRADTRFYLGMVYSEQGLFDAAEVELLASLNIHPDNAQARNQLGFIYAKKGLLDKAELEFKAALAINPELASARANLERVEKLR